MRSKSIKSQTVPTKLVRQVPGPEAKPTRRVPDGGQFALHPVTQFMLTKLKALRPGQTMRFTLKTPSAAHERAKSLRDLRKKKRVSFTRVVQRGNELYVER